MLNLAGNLIRKVSNLHSLKHLEELNIRRNRIRSTAGLEAVPTLEKLHMSNNEIQARRERILYLILSIGVWWSNDQLSRRAQSIAFLQKLDGLSKLHTVQMEGNPVWSSGDYAHHLVTCLPALQVSRSFANS